MTIEDSLLSAHGYQLLSIVTSYSVGNNREFDVSDIFLGLLFIVCGGELMTVEDPSLSAYGYQLLPLATSYLVGYNREFDVSDIFLSCFIHYWWRGTYEHRRPFTECQWLPIVAPSNQSVSG